MRKVYLDAESLDLMLVPTQSEYEFVFIQTEGKCTANIKLKPQADSKFKVKIYIYTEGTSEVDCVCTLDVAKEVSGVETDIQFRSWPFDRSKIKARPEMFIRNSNIVATHGNALGAMNKEDTYYLASRGIRDAKELIKQSLINAG
jgi:Fe-S cluster assembly scaffold protein SufB